MTDDEIRDKVLKRVYSGGRDGVQITELFDLVGDAREAQDIEADLRERGLVRNGQGMGDVVATADGRDCVESGLSVREFLRHQKSGSAMSQNIHIHGDHNTVAGALGDMAQATATSSGFDPAKALEFAAAVRQTNLELTEEAARALREIEQSGTDTTQMQRATAMLTRFFYEVHTNALGQFLAGLGAAALGIGAF